MYRMKIELVKLITLTHVINMQCSNEAFKYLVQDNYAQA